MRLALLSECCALVMVTVACSGSSKPNNVQGSGGTPDSGGTSNAGGSTTSSGSSSTGGEANIGGATTGVGDGGTLHGGSTDAEFFASAITGGNYF